MGDGVVDHHDSDVRVGRAQRAHDLSAVPGEARRDHDDDVAGQRLAAHEIERSRRYLENSVSAESCDRSDRATDESMVRDDADDQRIRYRPAGIAIGHGGHIRRLCTFLERFDVKTP